MDLFWGQGWWRGREVDTEDMIFGWTGEDKRVGISQRGRLNEYQGTSSRGPASCSVTWDISGQAAEEHCASGQLTEERKRKALDVHWIQMYPMGQEIHTLF